MLIPGKIIATSIGDTLKGAIGKLTGRPPELAVILVGEDPASLIYVNRKTAECRRVGIVSHLIRFDVEVKEKELLGTIDRLNQEDNIDGILVQMPLPPHIQTQKVTERIDPTKDVDGFHPLNLGKLLSGDLHGFVPCTPLGIAMLLEKMGIEVAGQEVVIVGRGNTVGKPLAALLMQKRRGGNATVTIVHSLTRELNAHCQRADILIAAMGRAELIRGDMVKEGAVVIDVGINRVADPKSPSGYRLVGDTVYEEMQAKARFLTPVPGGVGPMTVAMLLYNTWTSYVRRQTVGWTDLL